MISKNKSFKNFLRRESTIKKQSLKEVDFIVECRNKWKLMTEKEKFLNATEETVSEESDPSEKSIFNEEIENKLIDTLVRKKTTNELIDTKFFFMSSNIQSVVKKEFRPLEIGLVEYTIRNGIQSDYHQFINCGAVPYGHNCHAMDHMKQTHKIPITNFIMASNDYLLIGAQVLQMLSDSCADLRINNLSDKPLIVFSKPEQIDQNDGALKWIAKMSNEMRRRNKQKAIDFNITVLSASKLLSSLLTAAGDCHPMLWCNNVINSPAFEYATGTDCPYHEDIQCIDCAIGVPKRMAYLMSHFLRKSYDIRITGNHLPIVDEFKNLRIKEDIETDETPFQFILPEVYHIKCETPEECEAPEDQILIEVLNEIVLIVETVVDKQKTKHIVREEP